MDKQDGHEGDGAKRKDGDASPKQLPLHRRRFDAKQRVFPSELTDLPSSSIPGRPPHVSSRKFCEDLAERLQNKDENTPEELQPLYARSANAATAALITEDALDHLDKLYKLMEQLLTLKEQNSKIQRRVRDLEHIKKLQEMHQQIEKEMNRVRLTDPDAFYKSEATSMDMGEEYGYTEALLDSMLEAGRNASLKRAKWKSPSRSKLRQSIVRSHRSRSMGGEELESCPIPEVDYSSHLTVPYKGRPRRGSEMKSADKSKISKWTRVKAAFKWEKAHTGIAGDTPAPSQVARASLPCGSFSTVPVTPGTPLTPVATPASISPASSTEDVAENANCVHDSGRRSRSLDSSVILDPIACQLNQQEEMCNTSHAKLHKTPWGKMKDIIQTRKESVRKKQNRNSVRSNSGCRTSENYSLSDGGGLSQSESAEILFAADNNNKSSPKRKISGQEKSQDAFLQDLPESARRTTPTLTVTMPSSEELAKVNKSTVQPSESSKTTSSEQEPGSNTQIHRPEARYSRHQVLTKQKSLDMAKKPPSRPVQDSSDVDTGSPVVQRHDSKWKKVKKAFLTSAPASTPSSPSRNSAFFSYEPDDIRANCGKSRVGLEDEVKRNYEALQSRLSREFYDKAMEWNTGGSGSVAGNSPSGGHSPNQQFVKKMDEWEKLKNTNVLHRQTSSGPSTPAEDKLSTEFRKKLQEWQKTKGVIPNQGIAAPAPVYPNIPTHAQLSEDFRKKLEEWKKLKATNSVPTYTGEEYDRTPKDHERDEKSIKLKKVVGPQKKEVLVQTGAGFFRFEGISRSFTRKLHEWEKSRGIAPEASTTALLRESLARPPLPITRTTGKGPWPSGYQKKERGILRLQRSQSVGSVRDDTIPHISASASSLSLTHLDECSNNENQISDVGEECFDTSIETEIRPLGTESDSDGGPGAVLVEIEDEVEETAAPLVACSPCAAPQTPVYRYGQAQERHRACESTEGKLTPVAYAISAPPHPIINKIYALKDTISILIKEEENFQMLFSRRNNMIGRSIEFTKKIENQKNQSNTSSTASKDMQRKLTILDKEKELIQNSLKERLFNFNELISKLRTEIQSLKISDEENSENIRKILKICNQKVEIFSVCSKERHRILNDDKIQDYEFLKELKQLAAFIEELKLECTKLNIHNRENNLCITYTANKTKPIETFIKIELEENSDIPETVHEFKSKSIDDVEKKEKEVTNEKVQELGISISSIEDKSDESIKGARKKVKDTTDRTLSNIAKRKSKARQRLEREKSLHSESDTEEEVSTVTVEFPRRKKPIKSKSLSEAQQRQNSFEKQCNTDSGDNVFVLKLKSKSYDDQSPLNIEKDSSISDLCTKKTSVDKKGSFDASCEYKSDQLSDKTDSVEILISSEQLPIDIPPEGIEVQAELNNKPDIFVKTTRKIFSPVRTDGKGETKVVIGFNLEEIENSISKTGTDKRHECNENLPDILVNNDMKKSVSENVEINSSIENDMNFNESQSIKMGDTRKQLNINSSDSFHSVRSHSQSPLFMRKHLNSNDSSRTLSNSRNPSEESISQSKDVFPIRRGSGERFATACKGSPVLSRASTPGITGASLPPLPASPPTSRRDKPPSKETAPSIRIMIQKYNMKLNEEGADPKSQSATPGTPPWRSPRSQERFPHEARRVQQSVRNNPFYNREVQKSASASQIMKTSQSDQDQKYNCRRLNSKESVSDSCETTPPLPKKMLRGILKSSSAGSIKNTTPLSERKDYLIKTKNELNDLVKNQEVEIPLCNEKNVDIPQSTVPNNDISNSEAENFSEQLVDKTISNFYGKKIDLDLLKLAKSSTCIPIHQYEERSNYSQLQPSCSRAIRLKKAKEKFLASGIKSEKGLSENLKRNNSANDNVDFSDNRLSQISCGSDTSYEGNSLSYASNGQNSSQDNSLLIKSASVGMINLEKQAFDNFNREKGYESLPRNQTALSADKEISKSSSKFGLSNLASKFRKVRLRGKSKSTEKNAEKEKLDTVSKLCRQSLLVNLHGNSAVDVNKKPNDGKAKPERSQSQTDKSIFLAGRTGTAVAVGNEEVISHFHRSVSRSSSKSDNLPSCSKSSK